MNKIFIIALISSFAVASTVSAHWGGFGKRLESLDTNSDGKITLEEATAAARERFTQTDANKDGRVTKQEMTARHEAKMAQWHAKLAERRAARQEGAAGNGAVNQERAERRAKLQEKMKQRFAERTDRRFTKMDSNKDGSLDKKEFEGHAKERFEKMDKNHDGAIEKSEMRHGKHGKGKFRHGKGPHQGQGRNK